MTKTGLFYDPKLSLHEPNAGHPESVYRLDVINASLCAQNIFALTHNVAGASFSAEALTLAHSGDYVRQVDAACKNGHRFVQTWHNAISAKSFNCACLAVNGFLRLLDEILVGSITNGFCVSRPPGHHAEYDFGIGFCFFNTVAIAANYFVKTHGLSRVAVVDLDVHHGNGD